jgi:hypothetical protein
MTMKIKSKFSSRCPVCWKQIPVGESVEWERGKKAMHVACAEKIVQDKAMYAVIQKFGLDKHGYRVAHKKRGACFANMHEVSEAMFRAGCANYDRIGERTAGAFAELWKSNRAGLVFVSNMTFPESFEIFKRLVTIAKSLAA